MSSDKRFLVDVGIKGLPFPMRVRSRANPRGQATVADISISARIIQEFEARWIDTFIRVLHQHRNRIGTAWLAENTRDYLEALNASTVKIDLTCPLFVEKVTPKSNETCLVRYVCTYSSQLRSAHAKPTSRLRMEIPCITTYPSSSAALPGGLFGQLSIVTVEAEAKRSLYPEDLVDIVDRHAVAPVYSYLTDDDQSFIVERVHSLEKTSVVVADEVKQELVDNPAITSYAVHCSNYGMLRPYTTVLATEKNRWVPDSSWVEEGIEVFGI